jgi:hypothetical protein
VRPSGTLPFKVRMPSGNRAPRFSSEKRPVLTWETISRLPADGNGGCLIPCSGLHCTP